MIYDSLLNIIRALLQYPYLIVSLVLLFLFLLGYIVSNNNRSLLFLSGLLSIPFCLYEFVFIPEYWTPYSGGRILGISDFIFSFSTGGIAWFLATSGLAKNYNLSWNINHFFRRFTGCAVLGVFFSVVLWYLGIKIMTAVLIIIFLGFIVLYFRCTNVNLLKKYKFVYFAIIYFIVIKISFIIFPELSFYWNPNNLSGLYLLEIPLEEVLWALAFGTIWPVFIVYIFDVNIENHDDCRFKF